MYEEYISKEYITYGLGEYDPEKFESVKNRDWNKPLGGLWSSPKDSTWGWKNWCESEEFTKNDGLSNWFTFKLKPDSKIYIINSVFDFEWLRRLDLLYKPSVYNNMDWYNPRRDDVINFEEVLHSGFGGIILTAAGQSATRMETSLYGWDCESLLILDKDIIINVENKKEIGN